jgi:hypothetical protein
VKFYNFITFAFDEEKDIDRSKFKDKFTTRNQKNKTTKFIAELYGFT